MSPISHLKNHLLITKKTKKKTPPLFISNAYKSYMTPPLLTQTHIFPKPHSKSLFQLPVHLGCHRTSSWIMLGWGFSAFVHLIHLFGDEGRYSWMWNLLPPHLFVYFFGKTHPTYLKRGWMFEGMTLLKYLSWCFCALFSSLFLLL